MLSQIQPEYESLYKSLNLHKRTQSIRNVSTLKYSQYPRVLKIICYNLTQINFLFISKYKYITIGN